MLYYGDEIGMGDNIWLGDRDGVRTPMQWTPDRNAGFSTATPGQLHLPVIQDPVFGYQRVNVEAELENSSSLLHWTRRMIHVRRQHPGLRPRARFTDLGGSNPSVLSYVREHDDDTVLCVNNLSRFPQPVELDLRRWEGGYPVELLGGVALPHHRRAALPADAQRARLLLVPHLPTGGLDPVTAPLTDVALPDLERFLASARWFGGKGRPYRATGVRRVGRLPAGPDEPTVAIDLLEVTYDDVPDQGGRAHRALPAPAVVLRGAPGAAGTRPRR